jgi:hypothetical protein
MSRGRNTADTVGEAGLSISLRNLQVSPRDPSTSLRSAQDDKKSCDDFFAHGNLFVR